jgi:hypothetical protein
MPETARMTDTILFENAAILDGTADGCCARHVWSRRHHQSRDKPVAAVTRARIDLRGRT